MPGSRRNSGAVPAGQNESLAAEQQLVENANHARSVHLATRERRGGKAAKTRKSTDPKAKRRQPKQMERLKLFLDEVDLCGQWRNRINLPDAHVLSDVSTDEDLSSGSPLGRSSSIGQLYGIHASTRDPRATTTSPPSRAALPLLKLEAPPRPLTRTASTSALGSPLHVHTIVSSQPCSTVATSAAKRAGEECSPLSGGQHVVATRARRSATREAHKPVSQPPTRTASNARSQALSTDAASTASPCSGRPAAPAPQPPAQPQHRAQLSADGPAAISERTGASTHTAPSIAQQDTSDIPPSISDRGEHWDVLDPQFAIVGDFSHEPLRLDADPDVRRLPPVCPLAGDQCAFPFINPPVDIDTVDADARTEEQFPSKSPSACGELDLEQEAPKYPYLSAAIRNLQPPKPPDRLQRCTSDSRGARSAATVDAAAAAVFASAGASAAPPPPPPPPPPPACLPASNQVPPPLLTGASAAGSEKPRSVRKSKSMGRESLDAARHTRIGSFMGRSDSSSLTALPSLSQVLPGSSRSLTVLPQPGSPRPPAPQGACGTPEPDAEAQHAGTTVATSPICMSLADLGPNLPAAATAAGAAPAGGASAKVSTAASPGILTPQASGSYAKAAQVPQVADPLGAVPAFTSFSRQRSDQFPDTELQGGWLDSFFTGTPSQPGNAPPVELVNTQGSETFYTPRRPDMERVNNWIPDLGAGKAPSSEAAAFTAGCLFVQPRESSVPVPGSIASCGAGVSTFGPPDSSDLTPEPSRMFTIGSSGGGLALTRAATVQQREREQVLRELRGWLGKPYSMANVEEAGGWRLGSMKLQLLAIDLLLDIVKAAVDAALHKQGHAMLAAQTLHHMLQVDLVWYKDVCPFGLAAPWLDRHTPYELPADQSMAFAPSLSFAAVNESIREMTKSNRHCAVGGVEQDTILSRFCHVAAQVIPNLVPREAPLERVEGYRELLKRLRDFMDCGGLDGHVLSLRAYGVQSYSRDPEFRLITLCADAQLNPPALAFFVLDTLTMLMTTTRHLLCGALDSLPHNEFKSEAAKKSQELIRSICDFWLELATMALGICQQIAEFLLSDNRVDAFATCFYSDSLVWTQVLQFFLVELLPGRDDPESQVFHYGLLHHFPQALCGARLHAHGGQVQSTGAAGHPRSTFLEKLTSEFRVRVSALMIGRCGTLMQAFSRALQKLSSQQAYIRFSSEGDGMEPISEAEVERWMRELSSNVADGVTRQLKIHVANAEWFLHILRVAVNLTRNNEVHMKNGRLVNNGDNDSLASFREYGELSETVDRVFENYVVFWAHTMHVYYSFLTRQDVNFEYDPELKHFKPFSRSQNRALQHHVRLSMELLFTMQNISKYSWRVFDLLFHLKDRRCARVMQAEALRAHGVTIVSALNWLTGLQKFVDVLVQRRDNCQSLLWDSSRSVAMSGSGCGQASTSGVLVDELVFSKGQGRATNVTDNLRRHFKDLSDDLFLDRCAPVNRSTRGIRCHHGMLYKHDIILAHEPTVMPAAIKWFTMNSLDLNNEASEARQFRADESAQAAAQALIAEWEALSRLRTFLQHPEAVAGAPGFAKARHSRGVHFSETNVVTTYGVRCNTLPMPQIKELLSEAHAKKRISQEMWNGSKIGVAMEWLPNDSIEGMRHTAATLSTSALLAAMRSAGNGTSDRQQQREQEQLQKLHHDLHKLGLADFLLGKALQMPCPHGYAHRARHEWAAAGVDARVVAPEADPESQERWRKLRTLLRDRSLAIKLIPPERGRTPLARHSSDAQAADLDILHSWYGVFKASVSFGAHRQQVSALLCLSFKWTLQLMLQVAKGVALCHQAGVVHRDLEPWNLMFDSHGRVKVIDFATSIVQGEKLKEYGIPELDHLLFLPPEFRSPRKEGMQRNDWLKRNWELQQKADIWTVAIVFWEMITLKSLKALVPSAMREERRVLNASGDGIAERDLLASVAGKAQDVRREAEEVPPLPGPDFVRPALFSPDDHEQETNWYTEWLATDIRGGYARLRHLIMSMMDLTPKCRPTAVEIAMELNSLLKDYKKMM